MQAGIHLFRQGNLVHVTSYHPQERKVCTVIQPSNFTTQIQQMTWALFFHLLLSLDLNVFLNINILIDMLKTKHKLKYSVERG